MNAIVVGEEVRLNGALLISKKDLVTVLLSIPFSTCHQSFLAAAKVSSAGLPDTLVKQWFDVRLTLMTEALDVECLLHKLASLHASFLHHPQHFRKHHRRPTFL